MPAGEELELARLRLEEARHQADIELRSLGPLESLGLYRAPEPARG